MSRMLRMSEQDLLDKKKRGSEALPLPSEHDEQVLFFKWWWDYADMHRLNRKLCFCIPNASALSGAGRIYKWAEGLTAGVYDIFMAVPRNGAPGLFIEMKRKDNKASDAQKDFGQAVDERGYANAVCYSAKAAITVAEKYLKG